jgi:GTP-binding protein
VTLPRVAIVGRPNVGKSSLMNRLAGRRVSIVEPTAGVTRDRISVIIRQDGRAFELVDTGGLGLVDEALLKNHIEEQIQIALETADLILFVVDGKEGRVPSDDMVARKLRQLGKKALLVVNKIESHYDELGAPEWLRIGFGDPLVISAKEGFGIHELLERVAQEVPEVVDPDAAGEDRVIVSDVPGTTRDAVDIEFEHDGKKLLAIDTAGVRKKKSVEHAIEIFAHSRSTESIRRAHVCIHMFDVREKISQVDKNLAAYCVEHSKPVILVGNKVDLAPKEGPKAFDIEKWDK